MTTVSAQIKFAHDTSEMKRSIQCPDSFLETQMLYNFKISFLLTEISMVMVNVNN